MSERHDYTVKQAANLLSVTKDSVRLWIKQGKLTAYKLNGTGDLRIPWPEIDRMRSATVKPDTSQAV